LIYGSADEMHRAMLTEILWRGQKSNARNGKETLDIDGGWKGTLSNPRRRFVSCPVRGLREGYPAASVAYNLARRNDVESICKFNPMGKKISDDGVTFYGANYGMRMMPALEEAIHLLKDFDGTRRAWVPIWKESDIMSGYSREGKDVPCTIGFGLRLWEMGSENSVLSMSVAMRSQSAWGVFPYDLYLFSVLQELIANELGAKLGQLHWDCVVSAHVFSEEIPKITEALKSSKQPDTPVDIPIKHTLSEAVQIYPGVYDALLRGETVASTSDPVLAQMIMGRPLS